MPPPTLECYILDTGYCLAAEHHLMRGGRHVTVHCHSLVALLRHPEQGWTLWDTGYAPRMWAATRPWPYWLYRRVTPLHLRADLAVVAQLGRWDLTAHDIRRVILSHFHADHLAGLRDFPAAEIVTLATAYADVAPRQGLDALRRAYVPALLPPDFMQRATLLEHFDGRPVPALGPSVDLFGDGSALLVPLPGHARGQLGLLARTTRGRVLFAADSAWLTRAIREMRPPAAITNLLADDPRAVRSTLARLHAFHTLCPDVRLVPTHCPEAFAREVGA